MGNHERGFINQSTGLILIFIIIIIAMVLVEVLIKKRGYDYYRTMRNICLVGCPIGGLLIAISSTKSIAFAFFAFFGSIAFALIYTPIMYKQAIKAKWIREKLRNEYGEQHPWINKVIYSPDAKKENEKDGMNMNESKEPKK